MAIKALFVDPNVLRNSGEFLEVNDAATYLQNFYASEEPGVLGAARDTVISGQVVALQLLEEFIAEIKKYNVGKTEPETIIAVRIYSALSNRRNSTTLPPNALNQMPNKNIRDIILEPVKADGNDFHDINKPPAVKDKLLVGMALPCPNVCPIAFIC